MGTKKTADRHKPSRMCRIRERLAAQADRLCERLDQGFTQVVNDALREKLEREGLWPPPPPKKEKHP
jgi:hypothetical protein